MKALIIGSGVSGRSAYDFLKNKGHQVEFAKEEDLKTITFKRDYLDRLFEGLSFIVVSPGVSLEVPLIVEAKKRHIKIVGEFD